MILKWLSFQGTWKKKKNFPTRKQRTENYLSLQPLMQEQTGFTVTVGQGSYININLMHSLLKEVISNSK